MKTKHAAANRTNVIAYNPPGDSAMATRIATAPNPAAARSARTEGAYDYGLRVADTYLPARGMGSEVAQKRVLAALLERHPRMVPADELRAELADVHDIDLALTALIADGLVTRLGELMGASWAVARAHRLGAD